MVLFRIIPMKHHSMRISRFVFFSIYLLSLHHFETLICKITHFVHKRILKNIQMFYLTSLLLRLWYFSGGHGKSFVVKKYRSL